MQVWDWVKDHVEIPVRNTFFVQGLGDGTGSRKVVGYVVKPAHDFSLPKIRRFPKYTPGNSGL